SPGRLRAYLHHHGVRLLPGLRGRHGSDRDHRRPGNLPGPAPLAEAHAERLGRAEGEPRDAGRRGGGIETQGRQAVEQRAERDSGLELRQVVAEAEVAAEAEREVVVGTPVEVE